MNICILSNYSKTYLFEAVGKVLAPYGFNIYWIVSNQKLYDYLAEHTTADKLLLVNRKNISAENKPIDEFKLNELVYGDRVLRHTPEESLQFLTNIQAPIYDFIKKNDIRSVFGEITWAHEILTHRICSKRTELNCQFLNPHVVRIPNLRFAFFTDEYQSQFLEIDRPANYSWEKLIAKAPSYLKINNKILKKGSSLAGRADRLKRFISNEDMDINDPTLLKDPKARIKKSVQEEWRKEAYKKIKCAKFEDHSEAPFVFLGLHKQPEASVDVLGRYYEDQLQNIKNLWRALPTGWKLIIKEHSVAIGDRSLEFYKIIQALPNVVLVDEKSPSYPIIKKAELVATISGTIAYEAALMGVPSITFAPTFFNRMNRCAQVSLEDLKKSNLKELSIALKGLEDNTEVFSEYVYKNTFSGNVYDPITDPNVLEKENLDLLATAIMDALLIEV